MVLEVQLVHTWASMEPATSVGPAAELPANNLRYVKLGLLKNN